MDILILIIVFFLGMGVGVLVLENNYREHIQFLEDTVEALDDES